nr:hypothetical protein [Tanacetum cinerariifolium]
MVKSSSCSENEPCCFKDCKKNTETLNKKITDLSDKLFDANNMIYHYKLALAQVESRLVEYKEREVKYCEKIITLEYYNESNNECIEILKKKLETLKEEKEGRSDKNKDGLGYSDVPPPPAQLYLSPKKDLSWTGLPECTDDTITDYSKPSPTVESTSGDDQNRNSSAFENEESTDSILSKPVVKFVKAAKRACFNCGHFDHLSYDCGLGVKKGRTCPTYTHKSITPRPGDYKPYRPPMRPMRSNMNDLRPNRTSFYKPAHSYNKRPFQETTQNLVAILIQSVKRLERELKARTHIQKVDRGRSRPMDVKSAFLYGTINEEVYVMQPPGFQDPESPVKVYKVEKAMYGLHQAPRAWSSNTPMEKENPWGKDRTGKDVDLHLYRSMIGSLIYLTASRPDIMFAVYACARHHVTPKECHLHAVKR